MINPRELVDTNSRCIMIGYIAEYSRNMNYLVISDAIFWRAVDIVFSVLVVFDDVPYELKCLVPIAASE